MSAARITLLLIALGALEAKVIKFYIEPVQKVIPTYVSQLVEGKIEKVPQGSRQTASISLVFDSGYYILVDSPSATDVEAKATMLRGISAKNLAPGNVQLVVTTHGHPDHFGQGNFFPNARHFFGSYEYSDDTYIKTELSHNDTMRITPNVELWNTPGHTSQDVSVIVRNVPCCGTVAVVGDLFYHELDAHNGTDWFGDAWNPLIGKVNRNKVICSADYIIPGHGKLFKVTNEMKEHAECNTTRTITLTLPITATVTNKLENTQTPTELPTPAPESLNGNSIDDSYQYDASTMKQFDPTVLTAMQTSTTTQTTTTTTSLVNGEKPKVPAPLPCQTKPSVHIPANFVDDNFITVDNMDAIDRVFEDDDVKGLVAASGNAWNAMLQMVQNANDMKTVTGYTNTQSSAPMTVPTQAMPIQTQPTTATTTFMNTPTASSEMPTTITQQQTAKYYDPTTAQGQPIQLLPPQNQVPMQDQPQMMQQQQQMQQQPQKQQQQQNQQQQQVEMQLPEAAPVQKMQNGNNAYQNSIVLPVVESAASQLAKALNVQISDSEGPYPYTAYWRRTFKKIANDEAFENLFKGYTSPGARRARQALLGYLHSMKYKRVQRS